MDLVWIPPRKNWKNKTKKILTVLKKYSSDHENSSGFSVSFLQYVMYLPVRTLSRCAREKRTHRIVAPWPGWMSSGIDTRQSHHHPEASRFVVSASELIEPSPCWNPATSASHLHHPESLGRTRTQEERHMIPTWVWCGHLVIARECMVVNLMRISVEILLIAADCYPLLLSKALPTSDLTMQNRQQAINSTEQCNFNNL